MYNVKSAFPLKLGREEMYVYVREEIYVYIKDVYIIYFIYLYRFITFLLLWASDSQPNMFNIWASFKKAFQETVRTSSDIFLGLKSQVVEEHFYVSLTFLFSPF